MNGIFGAALDYLLNGGGAVVILWLPDMDDMLGGLRRAYRLNQNRQCAHVCNLERDNDTKMYVASFVLMLASKTRNFRLRYLPMV